MRVLMTADAVGGVWTYALELADALARSRVEVVLATLGPRPSAEQQAELRRSSVAEAVHGDFALEWMDDPWRDVDASGEWLLQLAEEFQPDLVHLNGFAHAALPWSHPTLVVAHSCVLSWWAAVRREPPPAYLDTYRQRVSAGLRAATEVVAPTAAMLSELHRLYGIERGVVVANARRSDRLLGPHIKRSEVLAAGRMWDEAKNVGALARVAPDVPCPVFIAGDAAPPGMTGTIENGATATYLGRLSFDALAERFRRAAIFCAPCRYEPFGLAALEAGLAGCALVLGDIPTLREVWGDAAVYVDPFDDAALRVALCALVRDDDARSELGRAAMIRASAYTPPAFAAGYLNVYERLQLGVLAGQRS